MTSHEFPYKWTLASGYPQAPHNTKVFTTFSCGGGSSMGYKLAGYNVFAANDIDPQMQQVYTANHHPQYYFLSDIRGLINKTDWPEEFKSLDVLDGSPPCSTFSSAGSREEAWGKKKIFREGQTEQTLDDLFFEFIALAQKLQPKFAISENVKGLLGGNAKGYVKQIFEEFDKAGYTTQAFLLNGSTMGLPQMRERVFFVSRRNDIILPKLTLSFSERPIIFREVERHIKHTKQRELTDTYKAYWKQAGYGKSVGVFQSNRKVDPNKPINTVVARSSSLYHYSQMRNLSVEEIQLCSSFPLDYNFSGFEPQYIMGMSVPPIMMAQVAKQVYEQWIKNI